MIDLYYKTKALNAILKEHAEFEEYRSIVGELNKLRDERNVFAHRGFRYVDYLDPVKEGRMVESHWALRVSEPDNPEPDPTSIDHLRALADRADALFVRLLDLAMAIERAAIEKEVIWRLGMANLPSDE